MINITYLLVVYRTIIFYVILLMVFKLMGKKEVGELTLLDLVVSILMAEIAAMGIDNMKPFEEVLLAIVMLGVLQFSSAFINLRFKSIRDVVDGKPSIIIYDGIVDVEEMKRQRYTFDDLMLQLRMNNISSLFEVDCAILEINGQLTVFRTNDYEYSPLPIIISGQLESVNLSRIGKGEEWVKEELEKEGILFIREVYYAAYDGHHLRFLTRTSLDTKIKKRYREK